MIQPPRNILFASDLSTDMKQVFEHAVTLATLSNSGLIVLHVMESASQASEKRVRMAFGETLYENLKKEHKAGAQNLLIGKNVDALRIRQAISGFFGDRGAPHPDTESPIRKILVTEGTSIANEVIATAVEESCGLIVMGCKQQGLIAEAMGNKLVRKILKRTPMPVFVVPLTSP